MALRAACSGIEIQDHTHIPANTKKERYRRSLATAILGRTPEPNTVTADDVHPDWVLAPDEVDERLDPAGISVQEFTTEADRTQNMIAETDRARNSRNGAEADRMREIGGCNSPLI